MGGDGDVRRDLPLYVTAIGLSAFLLFTLELMTGRLVLPVFGGAPSVWTTALCFYAGVVLAGYACAHLIATRLTPRTAAVIHGSLAALALAATLAAPADMTALRIAGTPPALDVLLTLAVIGGAPALLLSTTTPLLSAWHARTGRDAWWLYAVSNGASLGGLLAYPFVIEPLVPLTTQRTAFAWGLALLVVLLAAIAARHARAGSDADASVRAPAPSAVREPAPDIRRQALWVLAAFAPAGLLSATTTHLATDHTSTPLLWVGPLAVYLGSFVIAFSERGRRVLPAIERLVPAAATLLWLPYVVRADWPVLVLVPLVLVSYGILAVAVHGRLAIDRPASDHLTRFYLLVSFGGLLATAFVALVAPLAFDDVYEFPILIVGGLAALALMRGPGAAAHATGPAARLRTAAVRLAPYVVVAPVLVATLAAGPRDSAPLAGVVLGIGALVIASTWSPGSLAVGTAVSIVVLGLVFGGRPVARVRTFFGVTTIRSERGGAAIAEYHGTTLHGIQLEVAPREPTSYFVRTGPFGDVAAITGARLPRGARIAVAGLGVGTMAAYERPADRLTFLEIDPAVVRLARDRRLFTYLAESARPVRIVEGDARLSLADGPRGAYDLIVLDAFSSDAVPAHLLTREAMRVYARALRPGGLLVFNVTNRHFDLAPAVAATARSAGLEALARSYAPDAVARHAAAAQPSRWLVAAAPGSLGAFAERGWRPAPDGGRVLTDDFSDVIWLLRWR